MTEQEQFEAISLWDALDAEARTPQDSLLLALLAAAQRDSRAAVNELVNLDVTAHHGLALAKKVIELQADIRRFTDLQDWIRNVRADGRTAFQQLNAEDQEALLALLNPNQKINDA